MAYESLDPKAVAEELAPLLAQAFAVSGSSESDGPLTILRKEHSELVSVIEAARVALDGTILNTEGITKGLTVTAAVLAAVTRAQDRATPDDTPPVA